ncbi:MAG: sigma-70 family RNA polymerase sigma factor [Colwellia sp.]|nr:sigma-70 family RNA polymerase sigma factor [Colwellia sp.]
MDEAKLKELYDLHYYNLCGYCLKRFIYNLPLVQDIVQEVFIRVWESDIDFESDKHAYSILYKSAKNGCLNMLKSKRYKVRFGCLNAKPQDKPYTNEENDTQDKIIMLTHFISTLAPRSKKIIDLQLEGLTDSKIGEALGISINTVKFSKKHSYAKLRNLLEPEFKRLNI